MVKSQLLCTFTTKKALEEVVSNISTVYDIVFNKIYVLQNEDKPQELMCTYNVEVTDKLDYNSIANTISLHRKKHTNTLYTINALNEVIKDINNGVLDTSFPIPWENFQNTILVSNNEGLNKINTRIFEIIEI